MDEERVVIGCKGVIGHAIYRLFDAHIGIDKGVENPVLNNEKYRIVHICIPYSDNFESSVLAYIDQLDPSITIIHSTTPPGTTRRIHVKSKHGVVHVPFLGHHTDGKYSPVSMLSDPFLYIMSVGCCDNKTGSLVCDYVNRFGFSSELQTAETTEFAKIMQTNLVLSVIRDWAKHHEKAKENDLVCWNGVVNIIKDIAMHEPYGYLNRAFQHVDEIDSEISGKHCLTNNEELL